MTTKKIFLPVLIGILAISAAACGNKQGEEQTGSVEEEEQNQSTYSNSIFLGDSVLDGLAEVLDDSRVISNAGATAQFAIEEVDQIVDKKPQDIFIMLGSDDILMPVDNPTEHSMTHYTELIEKLKEELPNVKIHVLSVTPVTEGAIKKEPRYKNIPDYNEALKDMTAAEKVDYIDLSPLFNNHQNLHADDGIHLKADFYPLLLDYIKKHSNIDEEDA
ncbi:GDSL-type esterase/lipase family protein [Salibacterium aidingense]|uniref:GDSL-type esterase/lipase family protein n=1 Tax=Salibacterium aidingense TaxID=384933 RepID=UPI003BE4900C